jgi:hypothetical protein
MEFVNDLWAAIQAIFTHADYITLAIIAVIGIAAGFTMVGPGGIVTVTVIALIAYGVANYIRGVALGGQNASAFATENLHNLETLQMLTVLAYAVVFAVVILVVNIIRSLVIR